MKKVFTILLFVLTSFSFGQTSKDTIKGKLDVKLLNTLLLDLCNQRTSGDNFYKQSHPVTRECAEYQSSYLSVFNPVDVLFHKNEFNHQGLSFKTLSDRKKHFDKNRELCCMTEICSFVVVKYGKTTYLELANHILDNFEKSPHHRTAIFESYPYGDFSTTNGVREGQKGVYVTGVFCR
jgi:hypothetical protein